MARKAKKVPTDMWQAIELVSAIYGIVVVLQLQMMSAEEIIAPESR